MSHQDHPYQIRSVRVDKLFGRYDYRLPAENESLSDVSIIYGQNGAGKTTLLTLAFHLLSAANNAGHRTKVTEVPFLYLEVTLLDGSMLTAKKDPQLLVGPSEFSISRPNGAKCSIRLPAPPEPIDVDSIGPSIDVEKLPKEMRPPVERALERRRFYQELKSFETNVLLLTSDRMLLGDAVKDTPRAIEIKADGTRTRQKLAEVVRENRVGSVKDALQAASVWLRQRFFEELYGPGESTGNVYQEVVKRIAKTTYRTRTGLNKAQEQKMVASLTEAINQLSARGKAYDRLGARPTLVSTELLESLQASKGNRLLLINSILEPYLATVKARYDSIEPVFALATAFLENVNKFLLDKRLEFGMVAGLRIMSSGDKSSKGSEIASDQLSSGEQQLLLLFCHVLSARDAPCIFMIDEPELSLNVVWQRMLVSSLLQVGKGANLQLILASHSIEIISKHRSRVVNMHVGHAPDGKPS
jgi:energy-coupling factor transporter ATP-binding protein EcfA2